MGTDGSTLVGVAAAVVRERVDVTVPIVGVQNGEAGNFL